MSKKIAFVLLAAVLASCGKSSTPATSSAGAGLAFVRVVNGSPDIETVNPSLPKTAPTCNFGSTVGGIGTLISAIVDGNTAAASFPYEAASSYVAVPSGAASIIVVPPGGLQTGCPSLTFTTPALAAGSYQSVVIAGEYANKDLQFAVFADPAPSSAPGVQVDDASPESGTIGFGTFVPGTTAYQSAGSVTFGKTAHAPNASAAPGLSYFVGPSSAPTAQVVLSSLDTFDSNNTVPFGGYGHLSLYVVDGLTPTSPGFIGGFY